MSGMAYEHKRRLSHQIENKESEWEGRFEECEFPAQLSDIRFAKTGWVTVTLAVDPRNRQAAIQMSEAYGKLLQVHIMPWKNWKIRGERPTEQSA